MKRININENSVKPKHFETHIISTDGEITRILADCESHRVFVPFNKIPKYLTDAIVAVEDQRFFKHHGIDTKGLLRSVFITVSTFGKKPQGGSTITQQLIKNTLFPDWYTNNSSKMKLNRKRREFFLAHRLENILSKSEILENYLNVIYFGNGKYGVQTASKCYFGKNVWELSLGECALLAGIPKSPRRFNPFLYPDNCLARRNLVLYKMYLQKKITHDEYLTERAVDLKTTLDRQKEKVSNIPEYYSYFEEALISQLTDDLMNSYGLSRKEASDKIFSEGLQILSPENKLIQIFSEELFNTPGYIPDLDEIDGPQAAMFLMDSETGHVLATLGGRGKKESNLIFNRATQSRRNHHLKAMENYFERTNYYPGDDKGICIRDICLAYSNYISREKTNHASFYERVYDSNNIKLVTSGTGLVTPPKNDSLSYSFHAPLPPMIEICFRSDVWVVGRVGKLILGVWGGYDDSRSLPLSEVYFTYPRRIWKEIANYIKKECNYEKQSAKS